MINILLAGVGGQGMVLTTKILAEVGMYSGLEVKTNDVIGLSQRGGRVNGSVRMGACVHSPNIQAGTGDYLLAFEPLEALRYAHLLKDGATIIMNTHQIPPVPVMSEKETYPNDIIKRLKATYEVIACDAIKEATLLGSAKLANTILLGILASKLSFNQEIWVKALTENVPSKTVAMNMKAFLSHTHT